MSVELRVLVEKLDDDVELPISDETSFQMRSDGILLNGKLHFWEEIFCVIITNKGLINRLKKQG